MATITYQNTKTWKFNGNTTDTIYLSLSDIWIPPDGYTFSNVTVDFTVASNYNNSVFEAYLRRKSSDTGGSWARFAGYILPSSSTNIYWGGSGSNFSGSSDSSLVIQNTVETSQGYDFYGFTGRATFTINWTKSASVTAGNPIKKTDFDAIGWTATVGQPISHSGYSGVIYASTYNNLSTTITGISKDGGTVP